jgi:hypothetical protein
VNALRSASPPWPPGALRYSEDGIYSLGRPVGIGAGVFAFATLTLVALLVTCEAQTTWLPVVVMFFSGTFVVGTLILGLFYTSGLPDAMYIRIRNDRTVPIPLVMTATGMGSTTTFNTTWSGPEFLIGTKRPQELQHAVRNAVSAYRFTGGHPIWVALGEPRQPEAL